MTDAAADMPDKDCINGVGDTATRRDVYDEAGEDGPACPLAGVAEVLTLENVTGGFTGIGSSPSIHGLGEAPARPPCRIYAGEVHGHFVRTAEGLADTVAG